MGMRIIIMLVRQKRRKQVEYLCEREGAKVGVLESVGGRQYVKECGCWDELGRAMDDGRHNMRREGA